MTFESHPLGERVPGACMYVPACCQEALHQIFHTLPCLCVLHLCVAVCYPCVGIMYILHTIWHPLADILLCIAYYIPYHNYCLERDPYYL